MRHRFIPAAIAVLISYSLSAGFPEYRFHPVPETSYYGGVHSITKDSTGRMWFSGAEAVYTFDGESFTKMDNLITAKDRRAFWSFGQLLMGGNGGNHLYIASNQGLFRFNHRSGDFDCVLKGNIGALRGTDDGRIWIIRDGRIESFNEEEAPQTTVYQFPDGVNTSPFSLSLITCGKNIYAGFADKLFRLDPETGKFSVFSEIGDSKTVIQDIVEYGNSVFVLTTLFSLRELDIVGNIVREFKLPGTDGKASAKQLYMSPEGILWVATQYGLLLVEPESGEMKLLKRNLQYPFTLPNNSVWSIFPDQSSGIWIGTYGGKIALATSFDSDVEYYFKAAPGGLSSPIVSCFTESPGGEILTGTEGGGITIWDRKNQRFSYYTAQNGSGLRSNLVKKLQYDRDGNLWASFFNSGVQMLPKGGKHFTTPSFSSGTAQSPLSVYDFAMEPGEGMWLSDPDASLVYADFRKGTLETVIPEGAPANIRVEAIYKDGTSLVLLTHTGVIVMDTRTRQVQRTYRINDSESGTSANNLCSYCIGSDGDIWFGTRGGGVNRLSRNGSYSALRDGAGRSLEGRNVFGILEDNDSGNIWFSTDEGLYYFDRQDSTLVKASLNTPSNCGAFYVRSCFKTSKGEMLFGGTDGFILFTPSKIRKNPYLPVCHINSILVNNVPVPAEDLYNTRSGERLRLKRREDNIEIDFYCDSYLGAANNRFAYKMEGLSDTWTELPQGQTAMTFTGLAPGKYTFHLKAANNDGIWSGNVTSVDFTVSPSPFLSKGALAGYALFIVLLAYFFWRFFTDRKIYRHEILLEQQKEQNMRELTQARINFFTNISHDLKTPLTLIVNPLKQLKSHLPQDSPAMKYVSMIERNTSRIQRMISQLLLFRQIESQKITLDMKSGEVISFIDSIFSLFESYADSKNIDMQFHSGIESFYALFDHDVIEKIFTNLFSNAVKYTVDGGVINMVISKMDGNRLAFRLTNTSEGIPESKKEAIFEAFNNSAGFRPQFEDSTGLGLAIVKELISTLKGSIDMESGAGIVSFNVTIPFTPCEKTDESIDTEDAYRYAEKEIDSIVSESVEDESTGRQPRKKYTVVVIDDDPDLRGYIEMNLSRHYNVYTAADGAEGLAKVGKFSPHIVITDLMMEGTDGFGVCRALRSSLKSSHIPIIALSGADNESGNRLKALESGATLFIEKPFDMDFLLKQMENIIRTQDEFKEYYSKKFIVEPSKVTISSVDEELLAKAMKHIEQNIDNNDYDVEEFVSDMAIGRTLLYQKIKGITGMSIKEFIMDIRLKRAAQLLKESSYTISEISDMTGFANQKYFSICFKRRFSQTPSEYKKG
ncbi:MAG: response regulator [Candidatus Cryptobacteroides sp.]